MHYPTGDTEPVKFWVQIIANVGFPIAVSAYLLLKVTHVLEAINLTLARQQAILDSLASKVDMLMR
jgi:hypothetical protein